MAMLKRTAGFSAGLLAALVGLAGLAGCGSGEGGGGRSWTRPASGDVREASAAAVAGAGVAMPQTHQSEALVWFYAAGVLALDELAPMEGGAAFVGDSITAGADWGALFPERETRNFGINGDTAAGVLARVHQVVEARPACVFLMIGTNDVTRGAPADEIAANVDAILAALDEGAPETRVFLQSLTPRERARDAAVRAVNARLEALAVARRLTYVDLYVPFAAGDGRLDPAVTFDELHLTAEGYARWRSIISEHVETRC